MDDKFDVEKFKQYLKDRYGSVEIHVHVSDKGVVSFQGIIKK